MTVSSSARRALAIGAGIAVAVTAGIVGIPLAAAAADGVALEIDGGLTLPGDDGFRDVVALEVTASAETTVDLELRRGDEVVAPIADDQPLTPLEDGFGARLELDLADLEVDAGDYTVAVGDSVTGLPLADHDLVIGSGAATTLTSNVAQRTLYPRDDDYLDSTSVTLRVRDETGIDLPFDGTLAVAGRTTPIGTDDGGAAKASVDISRLAVGTVALSASVTGPAGSALRVSLGSLSLRITDLTGVTVGADVATVYPAADGYRDRATVRVRTGSVNGAVVPVSGTIVISRKGKTVATSTFSGTSNQVFGYAWSGRTKSKITTGTFTVKATITGPEGAARTASTKIVVSKKKLKARTLTTTATASGLIRGTTAYDASQAGNCSTTSSKRVRCTSGVDVNKQNLALTTTGAIAIPGKVQSSLGYRPATVRVSAETTSMSGPMAGFWYGRSTAPTSSTALKKGTRTGAWVPLTNPSASLHVGTWLADSTFVELKRFRIEYRYYVLK
jgi:hypothetical protein